MGHSLVFMPECHSTNVEASGMIESHGTVAEGTVIITNRQTAGRGQRGNSWFSEPEKNLTFSIIIKPSFLSVKDQFYLNKVFSLGLCDFLSQALPQEVRVKWPNDVMVDGKKVCGILIENHLLGQSILYSIVGIGLNVNQQQFSISTATSMSALLHQELILENVLAGLLESLEKRYLQLRSGDRDHVDRAYGDSLYWIGEKHLFKKGNELVEGVISGVDDSGKLKINVNGTTEYFDLKQIQFLE